MSLECSECEHDIRGGHGENCSQYVKPCDSCIAQECDEECDCGCHGVSVSEYQRRIKFEQIWHTVKRDPKPPLVPNDWPWEKRCAYWVWLKTSG